MRDLKFRSWDGSKMHYENVVIYLGEAWLEKPSFESDKILLEGNNPYTPMQFTGLLDRNGKEIFEGDIFFHDDGNVKVVYDEENASYNCEFNDGNIIPLWEITDGMAGSNIIIGNIYENGELITR